MASLLITLIFSLLLWIALIQAALAVFLALGGAGSVCKLDPGRTVIGLVLTPWLAAMVTVAALAMVGPAFHRPPWELATSFAVPNYVGLISVGLINTLQLKRWGLLYGPALIACGAIAPIFMVYFCLGPAGSLIESWVNGSVRTDSFGNGMWDLTLMASAIGAANALWFTLIAGVPWRRRRELQPSIDPAR